MSWDVTLSCPHCSGRGQYDWNHTFNVSPIMNVIGFSIHDIDGLTGAEAFPCLAGAVKRLTERRDECLPLEPENGWGSYSGLLAWLRRMHDLALSNPEMVFNVA